MHDPMTVAFELRRPWPNRFGESEVGWCPRGIIRSRAEAARRHGGRRWYATPFLDWHGHRYHFPALVTVWHVDPDLRGDDDSCRHAAAKRWGFQRSFWVYKLHVHHWRVQVHPWQRARRWLFGPRCAGCGKRFAWKYAPIGFSWEGGGPVFHHDHHHAPGQPPCSLLHRRRGYESWKRAYPNMVGGQFDHGDPVDNWLDEQSMRDELSADTQAAVPPPKSVSSGDPASGSQP